MQVNLRFVLLLLGLICFVVSAIGITAFKCERFTAAGLAFVTLALMVGSA